MAQSVRLSDILVKQAKAVGVVRSRSEAGQIEHWARIGKIAEVDNGWIDDYEFEH